MVRYPKQHKEIAHAEIIAKAGNLLRQGGFEGLSVKSVMSAVGLTHGGFYAHFKSRDAMLVEAMQSALLQSQPDFEKLCTLARSKNDAGVIAELYLSDSRIADVAGGCPAAALLGELGRQPQLIREVFGSITLGVVSHLGTVFGSLEKSWAALAMLAGSLSLMRAELDPAMRVAIRQGAVMGLRVLAGA